MVSSVETKGSKLDILIWAIVATLVITGVSGHYYFAQYSMLMRVIALLVVAGAALFLASRTGAGHKAVTYWNEAILELRKVVWPSRKETVQTTLMVLAMVFVLGLFLWTIDAILGFLIAWLTNHGGV